MLSCWPKLKSSQNLIVADSIVCQKLYKTNISKKNNEYNEKVPTG